MEELPKKGSDGRWYKPCPSCGKMQSYLRKWYAESSLAQGKRCKKCTQKDTNTNGSKFYMDVRVSWFNAFKNSATDRGLDFNISIEDVWQVFEAQDFSCALTGWPVGWNENGHHQASTASIDRIDSSKGYTIDNIQIVHKHVNMMKQHYDNEYFIEVCKAIADNTQGEMVMKDILKKVSPVAALADGGVDGLKGMMGNFGVAGLAKAMRGSRDEEEIMQNPRNVPVDMGGMAQPAGMAGAPKMMKKGGMVSKGIDGCATKGKTRANRSK